MVPWTAPWGEFITGLPMVPRPRGGWDVDMSIGIPRPCGITLSPFIPGGKGILFGAGKLR